jgi:hypothetical protein
VTSEGSPETSTRVPDWMLRLVEEWEGM